MGKHVAYNLTTGEILSCSSANGLKRWVARHTANDREWCRANGVACWGHRWVFAHGSDWDAKLAVKLARIQGVE